MKFPNIDHVILGIYLDEGWTIGSCVKHRRAWMVRERQGYSLFPGANIEGAPCTGCELEWDAQEQVAAALQDPRLRP